MTAPPQRRRDELQWAVLFLAGPVIWYVHFWAVYLLAEAGCFAAGLGSGSQPLWLVVTILIATLVAVALIAWTTWAAWRKWRCHEDPRPGRSALYFMGFVLGPLSIVATLFVGLPIAYLPPC